MPALLIVYYVFPYQTGAGLLASDGGIDWISGEAILALCSALLYIPLGLFTARSIWRRYQPSQEMPESSTHRIKENDEIPI